MRREKKETQKPLKNVEMKKLSIFGKFSDVRKKGRIDVVLFAFLLSFLFSSNRLGFAKETLEFQVRKVYRNQRTCKPGGASWIMWWRGGCCRSLLFRGC